MAVAFLLLPTVLMLAALVDWWLCRDGEKLRKAERPRQD